MAETVWQNARNGARRTRAALFPDTPSEASLPADTLLHTALQTAGLRCTPLLSTDPLLSSAHAVLDTEAEAVWYRADATPEERRLYIAHELAHFHQHEGGTLCACDADDFSAGDDPHLQQVGYGPRQRRETEANVWAREFLLPVPLTWSLFHGGSSAGAIAALVGVPLSTVYAQLTESLLFSPPAPSGGDAYAAGGNASLHRVAFGNGSAVSVSPPCGDTETADPTKSSGTLAPTGSAPPEGAGGEKLDASQQEAAFTPEGPLLVGAGPGTGKTRTLTARVLFLTREKGVAAENLLALTFSRKAAEEMRERIGAQAPEVAQKADISTFHSYGFDLLRRHGKAADLPPNPVLLDRPEACALLEKRVASLKLTALRYLHDPAYPLPDILGMIGRAKEDLVTPEEFARRAEASGEAKLEEIARVYVAYEALLREKGALDFSDLVCRALRLLTENDDVRAAEQGRWRHILVDEYQDINRAGALLVRALAGDEGTGLWAVGDLRQAIYRFRGASPANMTRFQTDFPTGRRAELRVNYRSCPPLVRLFGRASGEGPDAWQAARAGTAPSSAVLAVAEDEAAQADGIAARMKAFVAEGFGFGTQAVLCRTRSQARALRAQLTDRGIPLAPGPDQNNLLQSPDVKKLLALLSRACEPNGPARRVWPELPAGIGVAVYGDAYGFFNDVLWGRAGLARTLSDGQAVAQLLALTRTFRDRADVLLNPDEEPHRAFLHHLRRMTRMGTALGARAEPDEATDAVRVMTVHASKGLEFPVVFVPNLSAGKFPSRGGPSLLPPLPFGDEFDPDADSEEGRLFFVALTRARDHLVLSRAERYGRASAKPSPLLAAVDTAPEISIEQWQNTRGNEALPSTGSVPPEGVAGEEKESIPSYAADLYLRCPRRYFYARVEKVPEGEQRPYAAFKRAVAAALEEADPAVALEEQWAAKGPPAVHPHTPLYREAAEEMVRKPVNTNGSGRQKTATTDKPPLREVTLPHGIITVQADAELENGAVLECRTFRKPPGSDEENAPNEPWLSLLQASGAEVRMRYVQEGRVLPVADRPRQRANHLAAYDGALKGIHLRVFPADPSEAKECPDCPYFFVCPE